jgi:hypothetical protein
MSSANIEVVARPRSNAGIALAGACEAASAVRTDGPPESASRQIETRERAERFAYRAFTPAASGSSSTYFSASCAVMSGCSGVIEM